MSQGRWAGAHDDGIFCFEDEIKTKDQFLAIKLTDVRFSQSEGSERQSSVVSGQRSQPWRRAYAQRLEKSIEGTPMNLPNRSCWKPLDLDNLTRCESEFQYIIADDVDPARRQVEISYWKFRRPSEREDFRVGHAYR